MRQTQCVLAAFTSAATQRANFSKGQFDYCWNKASLADNVILFAVRHNMSQTGAGQIPLSVLPC